MTMTPKEQALANITQARESYKDFVAQVDADLKRERQVRLAKQQGTIAHMVAEAHFVHGASIAELKRAYNTKDHNTIAGMIKSLEEMQVIPAPAPEAPAWFEFIPPDTLYVGDTGYLVIELDDGQDLMLDLLEGPDDMGIDGHLESDALRSGDMKVREIFDAIRMTS